MNTEVKIVPPDGYEIDRENSTFECIKFKPKVLTYSEIAKELFMDKEVYFIATDGHISSVGATTINYSDSNNCATREQALKLEALNKLINVAKYLNGDWTPNFSDYTASKFFIKLEEKHLAIISYRVTNPGSPCFRTRELAEQAVEILGEETIKLALAQV